MTVVDSEALEQIARLQQELTISFEAFVAASKKAQQRWAELPGVQKGHMEFLLAVFELIETEDKAFRNYMRVRHQLFQRARSLVHNKSLGEIRVTTPEGTAIPQKIP
jgi:hypothetical protein